MNDHFLVAATVLALASLGTPAAAQHMHMPRRAMSMPGKPAAKQKQEVRQPAGQKQPSSQKKPAAAGGEVPAIAKSGTSMEGMSMPMEHGAAKSAPEPMPVDHSQTSVMPGMQHGEHARHEMAMSGALGTYPITRESSGTAWQPDASEHMGLMAMSGGWTLMAHGIVNLVYDHQSQARGENKAFSSGMLMGVARRPLGEGTVQLRAALSPDPLMGPSGYPLLLASGETANGRDRLIDRQHPHDFFMEMSGSISQNVGPKSSLFVYAGLPGEPAFGPPAFMHREAVLDSPEAPISHHWLDSTHISFGVVTAGLIVDRVKLEVSRFNGREPDQHRWNIETEPLDSTAARLSWNPAPELALQASWGRFTDPEQLEPGVDQKRWSASLLYARDVASGWRLAGTLAWGRKIIGSRKDDAFVGEASMKHAGWTVFGRGEMTHNRELLALDEHGPAHRVGKISLGAVRDFRITNDLAIGAGGLFAVNFIPDPLAPHYGGSNPTGAMGFVRLKLD